MRKYEVMYILRPDLDEEQSQQVNERLQSVITDANGEIDNFKVMGKRRLAYEVQKFREGAYYLLNFRATPETVSEFDRIIKITEPVIRHLIVKEEV